jgi:hypothetical protein
MSIFFNLFSSNLYVILLVGWEFYFFIFFEFAFYVMIRPHDLCYKFWRLDYIVFGHFFLISSIITEFVENWYSLFFFLHFLSVELFRYHVLGHGCNRFTRFDLDIYFILLKFFPSILGWFKNWVLWFYSIYFLYSYLGPVTRL